MAGGNECKGVAVRAQGAIVAAIKQLSLASVLHTLALPPFGLYFTDLCRHASSTLKYARRINASGALCAHREEICQMLMNIALPRQELAKRLI